MEPLKPQLKKSGVLSQQRPPSMKKDTHQQTPNDTSNQFSFMEISGTKITKASTYRKPNINPNGLIRRSSLKGAISANHSAQTQLDDDQEESKSNYMRDDTIEQSLNSTLRSEESNLYIDDVNDEDDQLRRKQDFNTFMRQKVEGNSNIKRVYDNHILEQHRRNHAEEEELKHQTSKPFQMTKGRMSSSYKQQSVAATSNIGSQQYEKSTEYGESATGNEEGESDFLGDPFSRSFTESASTKGQEGSKKIRSAVQVPAQQAIHKPFKISELKRNSSRTDTTTKPTEVEKKKTHLSIKDKKRIEKEEAILKKSKNAANVWKINPDPVDLRQLRAAAQHVDERRYREMEIMQEKVREMERKMTKKNKMKFKAMVEGSSDVQDVQENGSVMTEFDVVLAEREARQYQIERDRRFNDLKDMVEESVDDLSEMSAQEIRQRALFITDFGKKKSRRKQEEEEKKKNQIDSASISDVGDSAADFQDSEDSIVLQNRGPNDGGTFFIERNINNAFRSLNQQVELGLVSSLPEQARIRLDNLLEGCDEFDQRREEDRLLAEGNPYEPTEQEIKEMTELQMNLEAIKMDDAQIQNLLGHELFSLKNAILPKDQQLKEEAERKILREKMSSVNDRLKELFETEKRKDEEGQSKIGNKVEKIKIKNLVSQIIEAAGGIQNATQRTQELENLEEEFDENARMLEESRQIIARLSGQNIEQELGEFRQLLSEATAAQIQIEQYADIAATQAVMEEQTAIMNDFKSRFAEINSIQEDIVQRENAFMQVIKDNQLEGVLGIHFKDNEEGQIGNNNDYEVEDIAQLQEEAMKKLQEEIDAEILKINQKYVEFSEQQIDDKFIEMQEFDRQIEEVMTNQNPDALELLRQSVLHQQEEEDSEIMRRSYIQRPKTRMQGSSTDDQEPTSAVGDSENQLIQTIQNINGILDPYIQNEHEYKTDLSQSYYQKKKELEENLKIMEEIKAKQQNNQIYLNDEEEVQQTTNSTANIYNENTLNEDQFEDSLEM